VRKGREESFTSHFPFLSFRSPAVSASPGVRGSPSCSSTNLPGCPLRSKRRWRRTTDFTILFWSHTIAEAGSDDGGGAAGPPLDASPASTARNRGRHPDAAFVAAATMGRGGGGRRGGGAKNTSQQWEGARETERGEKAFEERLPLPPLIWRAPTTSLQVDGLPGGWRISAGGLRRG